MAGPLCHVHSQVHLSLRACACTTIRRSPLLSKPVDASSSLGLKPSLQSSQTVSAPFSAYIPRSSSRRARKHTTRCSATSTAVGLGIFFTPSIVAVIYAYFKGKGNVKDGLSRLLTEVTQGYFQPNVGGESIPVAQGELSDLAGDEPLFKALYQWYPCCYTCNAILSQCSSSGIIGRYEFF